ncbi:MAG: class I SAM-dependent methyltransferase [Bacteroidetes bacterium]|nr:MAG: class I SAM-dependent methyltransferase [Bacteroidota bacterium]
MSNKLSKRLVEIVDALPLKEGIRVLEIGCGPGAMARELSKRIKNGYVLAIDRSSKAIEQAVSSSTEEIKTGKLLFKQVAIESFELDSSEPPFDIAVAIRVGALDGRHPEIEKQSLQKIAKALSPQGRLFIDGGSPLKEVLLDEHRSL